QLPVTQQCAPLKLKLHLMPKGSHSRIDRHRAGGRDGRRPRHVRNGARRFSERAGLAPWPISRVAQVDDWTGGYSPAASRTYSPSTTGRLIILIFPAPDLEEATSPSATVINLHKP